MKYKTLYTILFLLFCLYAHGQITKAPAKEYQNIIYHFSVGIPGDWTLYGDITDDTVHHKAIADWGLPAIYSEVEEAEIENSISITAYHSADIHSADQLILKEYLRINPATTAMEPDSTSRNARIIYSTINGKHYKGKSYFVFKQDIGYVINFMATPGTFNKNIAIFETFYKSIKYL